MKETALERAIRATGGVTAFAGIIGCTRQNVHHMKATKRKLPAEYVPAAEQASGVSRYDLRPDIFGAKP